jgi:uncharacterized protein YkwD
VTGDDAAVTTTTTGTAPHRNDGTGTTGTTGNPERARTKRRPRTWRSRLLLPVAALAVALVATACLPPGATSTADPAGIESMINGSRAAKGLPALADDAQLDGLAQAWADQLAAAGHLAHQDLHGLITSAYMAGWQRLTENVFQGGASSTNALVENMWMNSTGHRDDILDPNVNRVGVGVAHDGAGNTYVVADFGLR